MELSVFLSKANENLQAAQLCHTNNLYNACANRAYYAMFQAAVAILLAHGFKFEQKKHLDHSKVLSAFANEFINRKKVFQSKFRSYLYDAELLRGIADYKTNLISQKQTKRQLKKAIEFVDIINKEMQDDQS